MKAFCAVLGFGPKRLLVLKQRMKFATEVCIELDIRGRHGNRPQKACPEMKGHGKNINRIFPYTRLLTSHTESMECTVF